MATEAAQSCTLKGLRCVGASAAPDHEIPEQGFARGLENSQDPLRLCSFPACAGLPGKASLELRGT